MQLRQLLQPCGVDMVLATAGGKYTAAPSSKARGLKLKRGAAATLGACTQWALGTLGPCWPSSRHGSCWPSSTLLMVTQQQHSWAGHEAWASLAV